MRIHRSTGELHFRVVFFGPPRVGKTAVLQHLYRAVPEGQRGRWVAAQDEAVHSVFFDLCLAEFGEVNGQKLRLHLHALHGEVAREDAAQALLRQVDAVVFLADAMPERREANRHWLDVLQRTLSAQGRSLEVLPRVLCAVHATGAPGDVFRSLGVSGPAPLAVDPATGAGVWEVLRAVVDELKVGLAKGWVVETQGSTEGPRSGDDAQARALLVSHYADSFGREMREFTPSEMLPGRPAFGVLECEPSPERPYWTYASAGVSLWPQLPGGPNPRLEFLAYTAQKDSSVAHLLAVLAHQIFTLGAGDAPYKMFDTVSLTGVGLSQEHFLLAPAPESERLLSFPDPKVDPDAARFVVAATGQIESPLSLAFIHAVPLLRDELSFAAERGGKALFEKLDLARRGKSFGWMRDATQSVLRGGPKSLLN